LRGLFSDPKWKIGVIWYLHTDEDTNDGIHVDYLNKKEFTECDNDLARKLRRIVHKEKRTIKNLENAEILKSNTIYFDDCVNFHQEHQKQTKEHKDLRLELRKKWLERAIRKTTGCNVIFLDPDNGMEVGSCRELNRFKSGKYAYYREINSFLENKSILVIYQHLNRNQKHATQIKSRANELRNLLPPHITIFAIRFKRYSPRAYFILCDEKYRTEIKENIMTFLSSNWKHHWDSFYENT